MNFEYKEYLVKKTLFQLNQVIFSEMQFYKQNANDIIRTKFQKI
jgi:hypothetical protein